jgi:hypothetical protein
MEEMIVRTVINANSFRFFLAAAIWVALASGCTAPPASGAYSDAREPACSPFDGRDIASKIRMEACVHRAVADAVTTVNRPAFFAAYTAHNRTPLAIAPGTAHRMRRLQGL